VKKLPIPEKLLVSHQLGAIVSAITAAGLQIAKLEEFPHSIREVEYDIFAGRSAHLPMSYLLQARKR